VSETVIATQKGMIIRPEEISKYIGTLSSLRVTTEAGLMSMMSVPLIDRGSVIGVLVFRSQRKNAYRDDDLRLAEKIGMQISGAIANSRLYNNLRKITIELQESEAKFRAIFENSIDAIGVSKKGVHLFANPSYLALYGYDSQEIAGKPVLDLIVPEERDRIRDFIADRSRGRTTPVTFETRGLRKDGGIFDMEVRVSLYSLGGDIFALSIIRDITALKEAEQELRSANLLFSLFMKHSPIYTFIKEVSPNRSVVLKASDNYRQMIGRPAHEMIGRSMEELFPSELAAAMTVDDWGVVSKGETLTVEETLNHRNYSTVKFPIMLDQRTLLAGFTTDITDQRKLEESLRRAEKMEALGHLAGGVAHDLNNVLGVTMAYAEMMKEKTEPGTPLRKYADGIFTSAEKAAAIIQDLLTMARRGVTVSEVVDLNQMVSNVLKSAEYALLRDSHPPVDFTANLSREPMPISGSQVHLEKTALNLISNAAESISGRGEVTIRTERQYLDKPIHGYDEVREGEYAVLTVKDTGGGIKPEDLNRIFEPFFTKKKMGRSGTGLGLAIVWGTVKDHEGYIDVASEPGGGTAFTLYFPVTKGTMAEAGVTKIPLERYLGHGESILVVDDVAGQREIAEEILTQLGYAVRTASSGEEAIEYVKRQGADIVILDMIMDPGIDGLDTYRAILKIHPRQKAIIVSGFSETDRVKEAIRLGAGAYVRKPYSKEKIGVAVQRELEGEWQGQGEGDPWRKDA
jgi:PAS domain S-box-containing protein